MTSQFKCMQNNRAARFLLSIYRQIMSAGSAQFLLTICWHSMSAGFVDKSGAKCGHNSYGFALEI